jgi:Tol biopolymer transport system component/predicted Ser/Thr protein kinase
MIGRRIDRYDVVERLGEGGMGVVYKARDTLLDRSVALKVLPPDKSSDPERRQRFLGEAKAASALNHPGIVAVHDLLTVDGQDVIVMELVEGETLETRLARRRLPLSEGLGLAVRIADALGRAHAAGIVHRDLKPSNVMVTPDGAVKILDFGLAKLTQAPFVDSEAPTRSHHEDLTATRAVVGTLAWMSPEQAEGRPVDARSDIFAFGLVLYELLTGQHPFRRGTTAQTLAALRESQPDPPTQLVPSLPLEAERAVLRCLRRDPARRWQSVSDLGAVLEDVKEDSESGRRPAAAPRRKTRWGLLAAAGLVPALAAVSAVFLMTREPVGPAPLVLTRLTYDAGASLTPAISPDGNLVAYASDRGSDGALDIWVRHVKQPEPARLTHHPADDWLPRFSPDGSRIVFSSARDGGGLYVIPAVGGKERRIGPRAMYPRFTPDGAHVCYAEDPAFAPRGLLRLFRVPVAGGPPEPLVPGYGVWGPPGSTGTVWSPDGRFFLFKGAPLDDPRRTDWWVAPADGGAPRSSGALEALPWLGVAQVPSLWLPGGRLLLLAGTTIEGINLYQARISEEGTVQGPAVPLTAGPGMTWMPTVSAEGRIALARFQWVAHLWEVPLDPETGRPEGPARRLTEDDAPKFAFSLSRDGDRLAYSAYFFVQGAHRAEVRLRDRATGEETATITIPGAGTRSAHPRLSPDGSLLTWRRRVEGTLVTSVAPTGEPSGREVCRNCAVTSFFADGGAVLVDRGRTLSRLDLTSGEESTVLEVEDRTLLDADLSWDDTALAVLTGGAEGDLALHVVPLTDAPVPPGAWIPVAGGDEWLGAPRWSANGRLLYYLSDRDDFICVWARALDPTTLEPTGEPFAIAHAHETEKKMLTAMRSMWSLSVGADRLVFNAARASGNVYTAQLPE